MYKMGFHRRPSFFTELIPLTPWTMYASVHHGVYRRKMLLFVAISSIFTNNWHMLLPKDCIQKLQSSKMLNSVERETVHHFDDITFAKLMMYGCVPSVGMR